MKIKKKIRLEYFFEHVSKNSIWDSVSTSEGLAEWFADEVTERDNIILFTWNKNISRAEIVRQNPFVYIRFHWSDDDPIYYFEFRLRKIELISSYVLEVIDFVEPTDSSSVTALWDTQVKKLMNRLGSTKHG